MNLNIIRPKNETQDLLLSITKNGETLLEQTHRKAEETLEFKMGISKEFFHFNPPFQIKRYWMIGLASLELYNTIFDITEENNKFELYNFLDEESSGVSYIKVRNEIERDLDISDITAADLQDGPIGPIVFEEYREQVTKGREDVAYMNILSGYPRSIFQDFESYLRTGINLVEDDFKLVLDRDNSSFITIELKPGIYTFKNLSEALFNILQLEYKESSNEIVTEFDDYTRKTQLVVQFGIVAIRFDKKSFFHTFLGFNHDWDYKHYFENITQKIVNLSTTNKIHLKWDVIDGSVVNVLRQPIWYSFVLDKKPGYEVFQNLKQYITKKINKCILNTITFYSEDDTNKENSLNQETVTFTFQRIKV